MPNVAASPKLSVCAKVANGMRSRTKPAFPHKAPAYVKVEVNPRARGRAATFELTIPQLQFATSKVPNIAFVGGYGTGKSQTLSARAISLSLLNPGLYVGVYARTFKDLRLVIMPRIKSLLNAMKIKFKSNLTDMTIEMIGYGTLLFKSMEDPEALVSYETVHAVIDELDTLPRDKAAFVYRQVTARNRSASVHGEVNTIGVATTPEGFRYVWEMWENRKDPAYQLIRAPTHTNAKNLAIGYIQNLEKILTKKLYRAYVLGLFENMAAGSVYEDFCRKENNTTEAIRAGETLHIGMDFNVTKMAAAVFVIRNGRPIAVSEFANLRDTPAMCKAIRERYGHRHTIFVYPDPAGNSPSSKGADLSDFSILRQAGFEIKAHAAHPPVRARVNAVCALILNGSGVRTLLVNTSACPELTRTLEQQAYDKNGDPDKKAGLDHMADAAGYFIEYVFPIRDRVTGRMRLVGA